MSDFLEILAVQSKQRVKEGFYDSVYNGESSIFSLKKAIIKYRYVPIIGEVKFSSPTKSEIRRGVSAQEAAFAMQKGGVIGISVLTIPNYFNGSLEVLSNIRKKVKLPVLMKDILVSQTQIDAASKLGANAVLMIKSLFRKGYCELDADKMIEYAHAKGLEVLFEVHTLKEFEEAAQADADLIGINNRNLKTLEVDINVTKEILRKADRKDKIVVSESGIESVEDIRQLHEAGADAFLIGSSIMSSKNIESKVKELASSYATS